MGKERRKILLIQPGICLLIIPFLRLQNNKIDYCIQGFAGSEFHIACYIHIAKATIFARVQFKIDVVYFTACLTHLKLR